MAAPEFDTLVEDFEFLDDWEDRYRHVIELGQAMAAMDDALKVPATKVDGCASQVWLVTHIAGQGPAAVFSFDGDSDAMIVRGLIAVLRHLFVGLTVAEVVAVDAPAELARLGLDEHLSSQRSNGVRAMVERIQTTAAGALA